MRCRKSKMKEKSRWSKKYKCPRCGNHPLEIYYFFDKEKYICDVYVCDKHDDSPTFFTKEECGKI